MPHKAEAPPPASAPPPAPAPYTEQIQAVKSNMVSAPPPPPPGYPAAPPPYSAGPPVGNLGFDAMHSKKYSLQIQLCILCMLV